AASITTAGGTSASVSLNALRPGSDSASTGALGDLAVDASGKLWVTDTANPTHLLQIDPLTGATLKSIAFTDAIEGSTYGANYTGLQVASQATTLAGVSVPAGSLLIFSGYPNADRVVAINASTGALIASIT